MSGSNMAEERDTGQQGGPGGPHTPRGQRGRPAPRPASHRTARTAPPRPRGPFRNHLRSCWSGRLPPPSARRRKPCEVTERRAGRQTPREKPGRERRGGAGGRPCLRGAPGSCPAASAGNAALCGSLSPLSENSATGTEMAAASPPSSVASSPGSCAGDQEDSARDGPHGHCGRRGPRGRVSHQSPGSEDLAHLIKRRLLSPVTSPLDRGGPGPGGRMAREPPGAPRGPTKSGNHSRGSRAPAPAVVGGEAGNRP